MRTRTLAALASTVAAQQLRSSGKAAAVYPRCICGASAVYPRCIRNVAGSEPELSQVVVGDRSSTESGSWDSPIDRIKCGYVPATFRLLRGYVPDTFRIRSGYVPATFRIQRRYVPAAVWIVVGSHPRVVPLADGLRHDSERERTGRCHRTDMSRSPVHHHLSRCRGRSCCGVGFLSFRSLLRRWFPRPRFMLNQSQESRIAA